MNEVKVIVVLIYHYYIAGLKDFETPLYGDSLHIFQLSGGEGGFGGSISDFPRFLTKQTRFSFSFILCFPSVRLRFSLKSKIIAVALP